jgi:hypothetical protein
MGKKMYVEISGERKLHEILKLMQSFVNKHERVEYSSGIVYDAKLKVLYATDNKRLVYAYVEENLFYPIEDIFGDNDLIVKYLPRERALVYYEAKKPYSCERLVGEDISKRNCMRLDLTRNFAQYDYPMFYLKTGIYMNQRYLEGLKGWSWTVYFTDNKHDHVIFRCADEAVFVVIQPMCQNRLEDKR